MEQFDELGERVKHGASLFGLHAQSINVIANRVNKSEEEDDDSLLNENPDVRKLIEDGEVLFAMVTDFLIGDLAWDEKTQNPEAFELEQQFNQIVPDTAEALIEKLKDRMESGADEFDLFGEDDEL